MHFKTIIGLEIHVQLKTKSKMFCRCDNNAEGAAPNTLVCPICMGMPGTLPVANKTAIEWTLKTGLALNCQIAEFSRFDRKHYFYPDLPKGYQISQYDKPFCTGGFLEIDVSGELKKIGIRRVHLEEDAGKLVHQIKGPAVIDASGVKISPGGGQYTLVDLNRAGTPLMEIVSEPEINSPQEAKIFMQELRSILRYLDVSDADMEKGHLRCDANISIEADGKEGIPIEIKNMNSFRMVERALFFEEKRQRVELEKGEKIVKETRGWDDSKGITYSQRSKEYAQDYRYFPEPDLPPFIVRKLFDINKIRNEVLELPADRRKKFFEEYGALQEAAILFREPKWTSYYEKTIGEDKFMPKTVAMWIVNEIIPNNLSKIPPENLRELLKIWDEKKVSFTKAKEILIMMNSNGKSASEIIAEKGIKQIGGKDELGGIIDEVIKENEKTVADYQRGKKEALGFLVGKVMQKTSGQANPQVVNNLIEEKLS